MGGNPAIDMCIVKLVVEGVVVKFQRARQDSGVIPILRFVARRAGLGLAFSPGRIGGYSFLK